MHEGGKRVCDNASTAIYACMYVGMYVYNPVEVGGDLTLLCPSSVSGHSSAAAGPGNTGGHEDERVQSLQVRILVAPRYVAHSSKSAWKLIRALCKTTGLQIGPSERTKSPSLSAEAAPKAKSAS